MSGQTFWNPIKNPNMSSFFGIFGLEIDFYDFLFIDSSNASPIIV
jgi:hypothetical protein